MKQVGRAHVDTFKLVWNLNLLVELFELFPPEISLIEEWHSLSINSITDRGMLSILKWYQKPILRLVKISFIICVTKSTLCDRMILIFQLLGNTKKLLIFE